MTRVLQILGTLALAAILWGTVVEPRFLLDEHAFEAELPALPQGWDGKTVALLSDFQIGMWGGNTGMIEKAVQRAIEDSVSLVLIAGDFLYKPNSERVVQAVDVVRPLGEAGIPVVAVYGNHDYSLMKQSSELVTTYADQLRAGLEDVGVTVLENDATPIVLEGDTLWVAGVGSNWAGRSDVDAALEAVPTGAPRLWLMHNSEAFRDIPSEEAHLAFAGHTHGGQVRVIPGDHSSWLDIIQEGEVAEDGWAADSIGAPPNRIYINRGIGFSTVPIRINCRPELTKIRLRQPTGEVPSRGRGEVDILDT
ncbi:metallophosphoesterase [Rubrivirga sp.]|uniref:metallophosphoesterase n=1 Tax=Rubrivirga sp. TaxID=1885344 RepID=UPI003C72058C